MSVFFNARGIKRNFIWQAAYGAKKIHVPPGFGTAYSIF